MIIRIYKIISIYMLVLIMLMFTINDCISIQNVNPVDSFQYRPILRKIREGFFNMMSNGGGNDYLFEANLKRGKIQQQFKNNEPFFCDGQNGPGKRSNEVPTSVHKIRPGDIDIIAALGDSLTAGNGAMAIDVLQIVTENKGISWSIGGQGTWRKYITLPNILKEFNQNLYGYSLSDGMSYQKSSRFNVAEIGAMSRDIPYMTKVLVKRIISDPKVDVKNHWKLITLLIGANDFCLDLCYMKTPEKALDYHEKNLLKVLRTIRDNLPRTMVNVVPAPDVSLLLNFTQKPMECVALHHFECPCMFATRFQKYQKRYKKIMKQWNILEREIVNRKEFHNKTDFTVIFQPFIYDLTFPLNENGYTDYTYMSMDCFHLSQRGYARASNALWNNMLEPYNNKSTNWKKEFLEFKCPTNAMPYIRTRENSL